MADKSTWEEICERLWGPDWIAPLSETLHVNRRTVERWKSGRIAIPPEFEKMIVEALPSDRRINRELGNMLRRAAGGASHRQILDQIEEYHHAYRELLGMKLRRASLFRTAVSRNAIFEED